MLAIGDIEGASDTCRALIDAYMEEGLPTILWAMGRFRDNRYRDPVLDQPEFVEVGERLGFTDL